MSTRPPKRRADLGGVATGTMLGVVIAITAGCGGGSATTPSVPRSPAPVISAGPHPSVATRLIRSGSWQQLDPGFRLQLRPTRYGRRHISGLTSGQLVGLLKAAGRPPLRLTPTVRASLADQLRCHAAFAPSKPVWDLESWRPDVGYLATVAHECNPS